MADFLVRPATNVHDFNACLKNTVLHSEATNFLAVPHYPLTYLHIHLLTHSPTHPLAHHSSSPLRLDKVCIDQSNIGDGLKVLPVNVMACRRMLVLCGPTYTQVGRGAPHLPIARRLWSLDLTDASVA